MQSGAHLPMPVEALVLPKAPKGRTAPREDQELQTVSQQQAQRTLRSGVAAVWRDALSTFSAHSAAILFFALIGFAAPVIFGHWLYTSAKLSEYARTRAVVTLYDRPALVILLVQAGLGVLGLSFARGVITWVALHREPSHEPSSEDAAACGSLGEAYRITYLCYPTLLAGSLLYGALIITGIVATTELTKALEFIPNKMAHVWSGSYKAFGDGLRQFTWRGLNTLIPDPGPPFAEFIPDLRHEVVQQSVQLTPYKQQLANQYGLEAIGRTQSYMLELQSNYARGIRMMALAGGLLIFLTETLLRFRTVMVMKPPRSPRPRRFGWLTPLFASVRFGLRHFGEVTVHIWLVRLTIFALSVAFIEFPSAVMDNFVAPNVIVLAGALGVGGFEVLLIMRFMAGASAALVGAILLAFSVVYDARLYLALLAKTNPQTNLWQVTETSQAHSLMGKSVEGGSQRRLRHAVSLSPFCNFKQEEI